MFRHLESVDYDAMLEAGSRKPRKRARSASDSDHEKLATSGSEGTDGEAAGAVGEELLPTEDDFLRLDDMEAFVQVRITTEFVCNFLQKHSNTYHSKH